MDHIIYITDPKILAIPIEECDELLINVKYSSELKYGPPPECEWTANDYTKMRKTIFEKLCTAQKNLPYNWRFRLYEGYRSKRVQQMLFENEYRRVVTRHPNQSDEFYFHETTRLVSPVTNFDGSQNVPAHNTGGAVDVEILTSNGQLVNMGMTCKDWREVDPDICLTNCNTISNEAQKNRQILLEIMQAQDFVNYPTEWWHFSYGDRYWAYHKRKTHAIYGSANMLECE